ncbi:MAG: Asp-tRNA(Asn)/Glu-tRNA(Gln) amidotransferase subunit GatB [bacterium]|jgi:aspartyl-tRNA(Asn)/glutamyl-tRNA(Gln) amidotransferase subunit B
MTTFRVTIGLEVHVQLKTKSKMFCACSTDFGASPNTHVCPVCMGYPGSLPVMNREAIRWTVISGLMLGCRINSFSKFDRKNYFYPDMPKNYQITQCDKPLCLGGGVDIEVGGNARRIGITRIHQEEDVAKNMHYTTWSGIDYNRAGVPLMEIVSEPDMESPDEALAYLQTLRQILVYAEVSDCNMEEGNMRCDVNISLRPEGQSTFGTKVEIKNMNSFKGIYNALHYEIERQREVIEGGGKIIQETRRWDVDKGQTFSMRTKEDAHDYRYFPEPDLMPIALPEALVAEWAAALPLLPAQRREKFVREFGLPEYDAQVLAAEKAVGDYFEDAARCSRNPKAVSNWVMTDVLRTLTEKGISISAFAIKPAALAELVDLTDAKVINSNTARDVFAIMLERGGLAKDIVAARGLAQVSDAGAIEAVVDQIIAENSKSVEDFRNGKAAAMKFLVGQVMRLSKGKANPQMAGALLEKKLSN